VDEREARLTQTGLVMAARNAAGSEGVEGTVTSEPELRLGQSMYAVFRLAVEAPAGEGGQACTPTAYVVCFGALANDVACLFREGTRVVVTGRVETRTRTTAGGEAGTVRKIYAVAVGRAKAATS
jgi:single-stranded DNA-binding protein